MFLLVETLVVVESKVFWSAGRLLSWIASKAFLELSNCLLVCQRKSWGRYAITDGAPAPTKIVLFDNLGWSKTSQ
jgi:hypothetical protein